jgi:hypothetical protein
MLQILGQPPESGQGLLNRGLFKRIGLPKTVRSIGKTREVIFPQVIKDTVIAAAVIINPMIPGGPLQPFGRMGPIPPGSLKIFNLPVEIELETMAGGIDFSQPAVTDRVADLPVLAGTLLLRGDPESADLADFHE